MQKGFMSTRMRQTQIAKQVASLSARLEVYRDALKRYSKNSKEAAAIRGSMQLVEDNLRYYQSLKQDSS